MTDKVEQFDDLFGRFDSKEDIAVIEGNKEVFLNAQKLQEVSSSVGGKILIATLRENITRSLLALFETRKSRYVSDIQANFDLLIKLTGAESQSQEILDWLDEV